MSLCVKNGSLTIPGIDEPQALDLLIADSTITEIGANLNPPEGTEILDAAGCVILPGLIDLHVHFRDPGFPEKETTRTGMKAAAKGGFTAVCPMPNTAPAVDSVEILHYLDQQARAGNGVHVLPVAAMTMGQKGEQVADYQALCSSHGLCYDLLGRGIAALSEDGKSVVDTDMMRCAMLAAKDAGLKIFSHAEDKALCGGCMRLGERSQFLGVRGIPAEAESIFVARDILLSESTGCPVHFCHISTASSVSLIRWAKARGIPVTAETGPHYLWFTDEVVEAENGTYKMNPPLGDQRDQDALIEGLCDGTLDAIATDHAPHTWDEKQRALPLAPFGVVGLETAFAVCNTVLVSSGRMSLSQLARKMSTRPAEILGAPRGVLTCGAAADFTIVDPMAEWVVDSAQFRTKAKHSLFDGAALKGKVKWTLIDGKVAYHD